MGGFLRRWLLKRRGGGLLKKGGGVLRTLWRSLRSLTPIQPALSVSPRLRSALWAGCLLELIFPKAVHKPIDILTRALLVIGDAPEQFKSRYVETISFS